MLLGGGGGGGWDLFFSFLPNLVHAIFDDLIVFGYSLDLGQVTGCQTCSCAGVQLELELDLPLGR